MKCCASRSLRSNVSDDPSRLHAAWRPPTQSPTFPKSVSVAELNVAAESSSVSVSVPTTADAEAEVARLLAVFKQDKAAYKTFRKDVMTQVQ